MLLRRVLLPGSLPRRLALHLNVQYINYSSNMNTAYIWYTSGAPQFKCTVKYSDKQLNIERAFNFNRSSTENVGAFMKRVSSSIESLARTKASKQAKKKLKATGATPENEDIVIVADLLKGGQSVSPEEQCVTVLEGNEKLTLQLKGESYDVIINAPWITALSIPKTIMSECPVYPKIISDSTEIRDSVFEWYKSKDSRSWQKIGEGFTYTPSTEDIGYFIKASLPCCPNLRDLP